MPLDRVEVFVDDAQVDEHTSMTEFEEKSILLSPGGHAVTFKYSYNPNNVPANGLPPPGIFPERLGVVYLDDVVFASDAETPAPAPTTTAPTAIPDGADYYNSFEKGSLDQYPECTSTGDGDWFVTDEQANSGVFSVRSPVLTSTGSANLTCTTSPDWPAGELKFSVWSSVWVPLDSVSFYVDGDQRSQYLQQTAFEEKNTQLSPGQHTITFEYKFNPNNFPPNALPPPASFPDRLGAVFVDDLQFLPFGAPACAPLSPNPHGFEGGSFPKKPWSTDGDGVWALSTDKAFDGSNSLKSPNFEGATIKSVSNATLQICDDFTGGLLNFNAYASVQPPHDIFIVYVDGISAAQFVDKNDWEPSSLQLLPGPHVVEFSYQYNLSGGSLPENPSLREGEFIVYKSYY